MEPLGIQIKCLDGGGVFVSTVSVNSLASKVGLQVLLAVELIVGYILSSKLHTCSAV